MENGMNKRPTIYYFRSRGKDGWDFVGDRILFSDDCFKTQFWRRTNVIF